MFMPNCLFKYQAKFRSVSNKPLLNRMLHVYRWVLTVRPCASFNTLRSFGRDLKHRFSLSVVLHDNSNPIPA